MREFTVSGFSRPDGSWGFRVTVPTGATVTKGDVLDHLLIPALAALHPYRNERVPTVAEEAALAAEAEAARKLPAGWEPSLDGFSLTIDPNGTTRTKRYLRDDGLDTVAPCDEHGEPLATTGDTLRAFDATFPRPFVAPDPLPPESASPEPHADEPPVQ